MLNKVGFEVLSQADHFHLYTVMPLKAYIVTLLISWDSFLGLLIYVDDDDKHYLYSSFWKAAFTKSFDNQAKEVNTGRQFYRINTQ